MTKYKTTVEPSECDTFGFLYHAEHKIESLGELYKPRAKFKHGNWVHVATVRKVGDGHTVKVFECRLPARFFKLEFNGIEISTGTVDHELVGTLATEISRGMFGFKIK